MTPEERAVVEAALRWHARRTVLPAAEYQLDTEAIESRASLDEACRAYRRSQVPNKRYSVRLRDNGWVVEFPEPTPEVPQPFIVTVAQCWSQDDAERICRLLNEDDAK